MTPAPSTRPRRQARTDDDPEGSTTVLHLPCAPSAGRQARAAIREALGRDDLRLSLAVSELVANAVTHARSAPVLTVEAHGPQVRLEVRDEGPGWPQLRQGVPSDLGGRGLALVEQVADRWGVRAAGTGKVVWADFDLRHGDLA